MLLIKTKIGLSKIHGIGLVANQFIPKGKTVWKFTLGFDIKLSKQKLEKLPMPIKKQILNYTYLDQKTGKYILCGDDARFFNHSISPNTTHAYGKDKYGQTVAVKDIKKGEEITCDYRTFDANFVQRKLVPNSLDNPKIVIKWTNKYGRALFAQDDIKKGEVIAAFDGEIYEVKKASDLPNDPPLFIQDHAIQFEKHKYRDSIGVARLASHACVPNCGIKDKFKMNIKKGEEISFDYDMSENSDWRMECKCENNSCRKIIGNHSVLPQKIREKYKGYISEYLMRST